MRLTKLLFIFLFFFSFCTTEKNKDKEMNLLLSLFLIQESRVYDTVTCQSQYTLNPIYISAGYAERFVLDQKQYENVAITDSTWDISKSFDGFYDPGKTQMNSVSGDTLCDFNSRFTRSVKTLNPKNLLVSTIGGNDFLRGVSEEIIQDTFRDFHFRLSGRFLESKFIFVNVHPVKLQHINERVKRNIPIFKSIAPAACWVDPNSCFSNPVKDSEFLPGDSIHYSSSAAFCIREKIKTECGVSL